MAQTTTISADGDAVIRTSQYVYGPASTVLVQSNTDAASVTIGYADAAGDFVASPSGALSGSGCTVNHNAMAHGGVTLMARVSGNVHPADAGSDLMISLVSEALSVEAGRAPLTSTWGSYGIIAPIIQHF
jgi:hypothetical protein